MILYCPLVIRYRYLHATGYFIVDRVNFSFYDLSKFVGRGVTLVIKLGSEFLIDLHNFMAGRLCK